VEFSRDIKPQVHDLIRIDADSFNIRSAPTWVEQSLRACPWVVARRDQAPKGLISVGVRGRMRNERWGGYTSESAIEMIVEPPALLRVLRSSLGPSTSPAMHLLDQVIDRWKGLMLPWGPAGSVGFEIGSGCPAVTPLSDLDLVIRARSRLSVELARLLWECVARLKPKVDVRIETPACGFALEEYVRAPPRRILLHCPQGARLGDDPWRGVSNDPRVAS
jgi:phosphoribosyl-dephospho-CoA transferase